MTIRAFTTGIGVLLILGAALMLALDKLRVFKPPCTAGPYGDICSGGTSLVVPAVILAIVGIVVVVGTLVVKTD